MIIAIDPGKNGALVLRNGNEILSVDAMPDTCTDLSDLLDRYKCISIQENSRLTAYLEQVHAMPGQGTVSMFTFGQGFGHLEQALADFRIRTVKVQPNAWQTALSLSSKGKTKREHKNILKQKAQELFPDIKITLANADALLISEYGQIKENKQ